MKLCTHATSIGNISIVEHNAAITHLFFPEETLPEHAEKEETELLVEAFQQLEAYLSGRLCAFSLPLEPEGTPFMRAVWEHLCTVPYGTTASYKAVAIALGNPGAMRAVGMANNKNPIPIFIPCHRIIGANGKLVGYGGGLELKKKLLAIEGISCV